MLFRDFAKCDSAKNSKNYNITTRLVAKKNDFAYFMAECDTLDTVSQSLLYFNLSKGGAIDASSYFNSNDEEASIIESSLAKFEKSIEFIYGSCCNSSFFYGHELSWNCEINFCPWCGNKIQNTKPTITPVNRFMTIVDKFQ